MVKTKLKTRLLTCFWSLVVMAIGTSLFLNESPVTGAVVGGIGLLLLIGGIKGTTSFGVGSSEHEWEEISEEEILNRLRSLPLKKRRKEIAHIMLLRQVSGEDASADKESAEFMESAKFLESLSEIIKNDLASLSETEKEAYMKQITPDPKVVATMKRFMKSSSAT